MVYLDPFDMQLNIYPRQVTFADQIIKQLKGDCAISVSYVAKLFNTVYLLLKRNVFFPL